MPSTTSIATGSLERGSPSAFAMWIVSVACDAEVSAAFHRLDPDRYPATVALADELPVPLATEFSFGLRLMMAGLAHRKTQ